MQNTRPQFQFCSSATTAAFCYEQALIRNSFLWKLNEPTTMSSPKTRKETAAILLGWSWQIMPTTTKKESLPILHANRTEMLKLHSVPCSAFSFQICTRIKYINKRNDRVVVRNCRRKVHFRRCVRKMTVQRRQNAIIGNLIKIDCFEIRPFLRPKMSNCVEEQTVLTNLWYRSFHHFSLPHKCECRSKYEKCVWMQPLKITFSNARSFEMK